MLKYLYAAVFIAFLSSCTKTEFSVRFKNNAAVTLQSLEMAGKTIGESQPGSVSAYVSIPGPGTYTVHAHSATGFMDGEFTVNGKGEKKWMLRLDDDKNLRLIEE